MSPISTMFNVRCVFQFASSPGCEVLQTVWSSCFTDTETSIVFLCCRLFRESEEDDALIFDELIRTNPTFTVFNSSAQKLRQSKFHSTSGSRGGNNYSSSFRYHSNIT